MSRVTEDDELRALIERECGPVQRVSDMLWAVEVARVAMAAERERLRALVEAVRDANRDAEDGNTFRLLKPGQERAWMALLAGLERLNVRGNREPT